MSHNDSVDDFGEVKNPENLTKNLTADLHVSRKSKFSTPVLPAPETGNCDSGINTHLPRFRRSWRF